MTKFFKILLLVGVLGLLATGIASIFTESATEVVQAQLDAIQEKKFGEAYYKYTAAAFQKSTSLEEFREFLKPILGIMDSHSSFESYALDSDSQILRATFDNDGSPVIFDYRMIKQNGKWKIFNIRLLGAKHAEMPEPAANDADEPVREFLALLQNRKVSDAYDSATSEEFRKIISSKVFHDFINGTAIFAHFTSYDVLSTAFEKNYAIIQVLLNENNDVSYVQFLAIVENNLWKIRGIEILSSNPQEKGNIFNSEDIVKPVQTFIDDLEKGDIKTAYERTAKGFKEVTILDTLDAFIKHYEFFTKHQKINFSKIAFDNNIAIVHCQFVTETGTHEVEFYLTQENEEWKIIQIKIIDLSLNQSQAVLGQIVS